MKSFIGLSILGIALFSCQKSESHLSQREIPSQKTISIQDSQFMKEGKPYRFVGFNYWYAPYIEQSRLQSELNTLKEHGITNLRIMALTEGGDLSPHSSAVKNQRGPRRMDPAVSLHPCSLQSQGLDIGLERHADNLRTLLLSLAEREQSAVLTLNNWYYWSGGMPQYMKWAYQGIQGEWEDDCFGQSEEINQALANLTFADYQRITQKDHTTGSAGGRGKIIFEGSSKYTLAYDDKNGCYARPLDENKPFPIPTPNAEPSNSPAQWDELQNLSSAFLCSKRAQYYFLHRVQNLVRLLFEGAEEDERIALAQSIFSWQLANEPRAFVGWEGLFKQWVDRTIQVIKLYDSGHMVSLGSEGLLPWEGYANLNFESLHKETELDYLTIHIWPQNWGWYQRGDPNLSVVKKKSLEYINRHLGMARRLQMPIVIEEFGLARDLDSKNTIRLEFFKFLADTMREEDALAGLNIWAFGGEGEPSQDHDWHPGDDYIGDPPHEEQGWYSVSSGEEDRDILRFMKDVNKTLAP